MTDLSRTFADTQISRSGLARLYRALWREAAGHRGALASFMGLLIIAQILKLSIPYFTGDAVNAMEASGGPDFRHAGWDLALIFLVCVASWALHGPARVIERFLAIRVRSHFADRLYTKLVGLPLSWHEHTHSGDTIQRAEKAGAGLFNFSQNQFIYLQNAVSLIGPIVALFVLSALTGLAAVVGYLLIALVLVRFDAVMIRLNRAQNLAEGRYGAALIDCLGNIGTILTLRLREASRAFMASRLAQVFIPARAGIVINEAKWCAIDLLNNALRCGLAALYAWLAYRQNGIVALGEAVMVYQYAQQAGGVVANMAGNYQDLVRYQTDLAGADPILDAPGDRSAPTAAAPRWRRFRIEGLDFSHGDEPFLENLTLELERGSRVALIGESGSGKSTLLRLIAGLYPPQRGRLVIDGRLFTTLEPIAAEATLIPQEPEIFEGTIGHNLTLGASYDRDEIREACRLTGFLPVVERLPHGFDTDIAERGLNLSGGQKQRLALARGILAARGSSLLMLDEPTSALDPETEAEIYDNLFRAFPDLCILSSVHRRYLLHRFDRVIAMAQGRILAPAQTG